MDDNSLLRYSRQILLPEIGIDGQQRINQSTVLIMGMGGLGSPVALYLAAAGVGHLILCDFDVVELSNLQRQILHGTADIGRLKTASAMDALSRINPDIQLTTLNARLDYAEALHWAGKADCVLEGTDNFASRFLTNQACVATGVPFISAAVTRFEGQLAIFSNRPESACLRCVFPDTPEAPQTCSENGILAPVAGMLGSMQAIQTLKILAGMDAQYQTLLLVDAKSMQLRTIKLRKDPDCNVCHNAPR